jgi:hypothetical protein
MSARLTEAELDAVAAASAALSPPQRAGFVRLVRSELENLPDPPTSRTAFPIFVWKILSWAGTQRRAARYVARHDRARTKNAREERDGCETPRWSRRQQPQGGRRHVPVMVLPLRAAPLSSRFYVVVV